MPKKYDSDITASASAGVMGLGSLRINGIEILLAPAALAVMNYDPENSEHDDDHCHEFAGWPILSDTQTIADEPQKQIVRQFGRWNNSEIVLDIVTARNLSAVELRFRVDWREEQQMLIMEIPTRFRSPVNIAGIANGAAQATSDGFDHQGIISGTLDGRDGALQLLSRDVCRYDCQGPVLRIALAKTGESILRLIPYDHTPSAEELNR